MFCLQHRRAAGHDPAGERGRGQRADIDAAGAAVGVGAQHAEHQHLRHKQDQQRHERAAERRAEQQICARRDVHKERDVFDQHDDQNAADHHERVAPPAAEEALEARLICDFAAGGGHDLAAVQDKEQRKDRKSSKNAFSQIRSSTYRYASMHSTSSAQRPSRPQPMRPDAAGGRGRAAS